MLCETSRGYLIWLHPQDSDKTPKETLFDTEQHHHWLQSHTPQPPLESTPSKAAVHSLPYWCFLNLFTGPTTEQGVQRVLGILGNELPVGLWAVSGPGLFLHWCGNILHTGKAFSYFPKD